MYKIKEAIINKYTNNKEYGTVRRIATITGLNEGFVSQILKGTRSKAKKVCIYAITKAVSKNLEITDLFDIL